MDRLQEAEPRRAAGVGLVAALDARPLLGAHGTGARIGQEVDEDVGGVEVEQVVARPQGGLALGDGGQADGLNGLDPERLDDRPPTFHSVRIRAEGRRGGRLAWALFGPFERRRDWRRAPMSWDELGGRVASTPAVTTWAANEMQVFTIGPDGELSSIYWDGRAWHPWHGHGGSFVGSPAVCSWERTGLTFCPRRGWDPDAPVVRACRLVGMGIAGVAVAGDLAASSWGPNRIDLFGRSARRAPCSVGRLDLVVRAPGAGHRPSAGLPGFLPVALERWVRSGWAAAVRDRALAALR